MPISIWVGLGLAILLDTGVQFCWKSAVLEVPASTSSVSTILLTLKQPLFYAAIAMFFAQFFNWMRVLSRADLSFAQPITAMSYVSVCIMSVLFLHEAVSPSRFLGLVFILAGVWFVSRTQHMTVDGKGEP